MPYTTGAGYMQHYVTHYIGKLCSCVGAMSALMRQFRCNTNAISASGIRSRSLKSASCRFFSRPVVNIACYVAIHEIVPCYPNMKIQNPTHFVLEACLESIPTIWRSIVMYNRIGSLHQEHLTATTVLTYST